MEWVETTGKTIEEAKEAALDQLGVDEQDAEFEVLEEPRSGLFGRTRGIGRVRARVLPRTPRPKPERRRRGKGSERQGGQGGGRNGGGRSGGDGGDGARGEGRSSGSGSGRGGQQGGQRGGQQQGDRSQRNDQGGERSAPAKEREVMEASEQCETMQTFVTGLTEAFGLPATVTANLDEDDVLKVDVDGSEVGLLIGPKLGTLDAIQEICRNVLQRQADGREHGKVVVDVSNVRELRRTALAKFVTEAAETVKADGEDVVFEVMSSADRKVVHDTVAEIDGVESGSVGEDPRRRVVVRPA